MKIATWGKLALTLFIAGLWTACDDDGGGESHDFGDNDPNVVVALGDSITAGYPGGLVPYPAILSSMVAKRVVNGGVSGNTSGEAAARVPGLLNRHRPGYLIILIGSNDAIGGLDPQTTVARVRGIIGQARARKTVPILSSIPPMYGSYRIYQGHVEALNTALRAMASEERVKFVNAGGRLNDEMLFQRDGLHPNQEGHQRLATAFANAL